MSTELDHVEKQLVEVWTEVLGIDGITATDNLFALGGTSLHAIRVIGRAEEIFGIHIPVLTVIAARDLHQMAVEVARLLR